MNYHFKLTKEELKSTDPKSLSYSDLKILLETNQSSARSLGILLILTIIVDVWHPSFIYTHGFWIKFLVWVPVIIVFVIFGQKSERLRKFEDEKKFRDEVARRKDEKSVPDTHSILPRRKY